MEDRRPFGAVVCVVALSLSSAGAASQDRGAVGATVVRIDGEDLFVDLGGEQARRGLELDVYRTIEVRHPVTRRQLRDRFVIAKVRIQQPGETLSIARVVGTPHWPVEVGDRAEHGAAPRPSQAQRVAAAEAAPGRAPPVACPEVSCAPCPECPASAGDPEAAEVVAVWRASLGQPLAERERLYRIFLERNPRSRFVGAVQAEIATLAEVRQRATAPRAPVPAARVQPRRRVEADPLEVVRLGDPAQVAVTVHPDAEIRSLRLYVRPQGSTEAYRHVAMSIDPQGHGRATVPAELVAAPGFEYYVEAIDAAGDPVPVVAEPGEPLRVLVLVPHDPSLPDAPRSRVRLTSELVSFNGFEGNDWYFVVEGDFLYRLMFHALYGVRMGYGHMQGEGGTVRDLDELGLAPQPAGFTYGFLESELQLHALFGLITRITVGLGREDEARRAQDGLRGGFQLRLRIGDELGTNLVLAGETIPEIGQRAFIALTWEAIERWPMTAEVHVTDQPVNSDELGVRGVFEVGHRASDHVALSARVSYQGRTIDHAGLGAGAAMTFDW